MAILTFLKKKYLVHFLDVLTHVAQVLIFFLLGLLVTPVKLPAVIGPAFVLMLFLTIAARPLVTFTLLKPFGCKLNQIGLISWAGLRGAASVVFAIAAVLSGAATTYNLYNLVFCMVLFSISIQGTLLPFVAKKLSMIDHHTDVGYTFTDYQEDSDIDFIKVHIDHGPFLVRTASFGTEASGRIACSNGNAQSRPDCSGRRHLA